MLLGLASLQKQNCDVIMSENIDVMGREEYPHIKAITLKYISNTRNSMDSSDFVIN